MSQFRVEKGRTTATLVLSNGSTVRGVFFVAPASATHAGPERIKDVLNAESGFFPFEVSGAQSKTVLLNRDHVVVVTPGSSDEPFTDPGYEVATQRTVSMLLTNGQRLTGSVRVFRPLGRDRLSDYARGNNERFRYIEAPDATTMIVNTTHVIELTEIGGDV
jgi:hypothetical protein